MARKKIAILGMLLGTTAFIGCGQEISNNVIEVEMVSYKPESVAAFEEIQKKFNESHDNIHLTINSPNEAMTILKTRFIKEDYPDIIAIGGDVNYSNFLDANLFMDVSDFEGVKNIKQSYLDMEKELEFTPHEGIYGLPYAANAAGILYNEDMFVEHGWKIPETWDEFIALCDTIEEEGIVPIYLGFKDTWTCLAPWNALAVGLTDSDVYNQVNKGNTTFEKEYKEVAEKIKMLINYAEPNPYAYSYNDACTAFARGEAAMYTIGSYAVPQIKSVNPDMNINSFTFPANESKEDNVLNSGIDLNFSVMKESSEKKDAIYEVLSFLYEDETIQIYLDDQGGITCKEGNFKVPNEIGGMREYIEAGKVADFHDHHYPSEMSVDALIQTFLMDERDEVVKTFLKRFDSEWERYNRDLIRKVKEYYKEEHNEEENDK